MDSNKFITPDTEKDHSNVLESFSLNQSHALSRHSITEATTIEILTTDSFKKQFTLYFNMAAPSSIGYVIVNLLEFINLLFLGIKNDEVLIGACGLGNCFVFIVIESLTVGLGSAIDTFCSQAYGAKNYKMFSILFNRGTLIVNCALIPLLLFSWNVESVFLGLGYNLRLARNIGLYVKFQIPSIILEVQSMLIKRFLQAQRVFHIQFYISVVATSVHAIGCFIFIYLSDLEMIGAALALDIASTVQFITYYQYVKRNEDYSKCWIKYDKDSFENWSEYLKIAIPNAAMIVPEYLGLFVLGFEAGYLTPTELAAHAIITNILNFVYGIAYGYNVCTTTLAGNSLGESRPDLTAKLPMIVYKCYYISLFCVCFVLLILRTPIIMLFTREPSVVKLGVSLFPLVLFTQITDGFQAIMSGMIRGVGRTTLAAIGNLFAYILILHPVAILLAFPCKLGVFGLWIGWFVGTGFSGAFYWFAWKILDLREISKQIHEDAQSQVMDEITKPIDNELNE